MSGLLARAYYQVDVFGCRPGKGNAVAVIDGDGLSDEAMATIARWSHLPETAFLLAPSASALSRGADYRARIFTPRTELPFAGHPTLGCAAAWEAHHGGQSGGPAKLLQECALGLIAIQREHREHFAFRAPQLQRSGRVDPATLGDVATTLRVSDDEILDCAWADNGPGWIGVQLRDAAAVLAVSPDFRLMAAYGLSIGVCGLCPDSHGPDVRLEVRAFTPADGPDEDPVTGSLHAALAQWLQPKNVLPTSFTARQGRAIGFDGYASIRTDAIGTWVSGQTRILVRGTICI
ncbi:MAG TPA: PhzF family phenazine biosynthesis protein [Mycobacterium sp.]|nr:PhzF family phenazine biosynthesis protein [Mycobacterium sp.]